MYAHSAILCPHSSYTKPIMGNYNISMGLVQFLLLDCIFLLITHTYMRSLLIVIKSHIMQANTRKFYDIAANLTDDQFSGHYYDKNFHPDDRKEVIQRAHQYGCEYLLIAAGNLEDAHKSH